MKLTMSVSKGNPAVMYSKRNGQLYGAKIVHTDYVTNAVVYGCGQVSFVRGLLHGVKQTTTNWLISSLLR